MTNHLDAFDSFDSFCKSPQDLFTRPPSSTFDLAGWFDQICDLNITAVEEDLLQYRLVKAFKNTVSLLFIFQHLMIGVGDRP